jgi:hypothetical protein
MACKDNFFPWSYLLLHFLAGLVAVKSQRSQRSLYKEMKREGEIDFYCGISYEILIAKARIERSSSLPNNKFQDLN